MSGKETHEKKIGNEQDVLTAIKKVAAIDRIEAMDFFQRIKVVIRNIYISANKLTAITNVMQTYGFEFREISFDVSTLSLYLYYQR